MAPDGTKEHRLADGSRLFVHPQGCLQLHDLGGGVALHVCTGILVFARHVQDDGERLIAAYGRAIFFVDSHEAKMMTTEFRDSMTSWVKKRADVAQSHLLIRSKLWEMAISVAKLIVGADSLFVYSNVQAWEAAGRRFAAGFRRRPLVVPDDLRDAPPSP